MTIRRQDFFANIDLTTANCEEDKFRGIIDGVHQMFIDLIAAEGLDQCTAATNFSLTLLEGMAKNGHPHCAIETALEAVHRINQMCEAASKEEEPRGHH